MDEELRKLLYRCALDSPGSWLLSALRLKQAAEKVDCFGGSGADNPDALFMFPVFKLLLGLSFENLLKGIIAAQRGTAGATGKLDKDLGVHRMTELLALLDRAAISISTEEESLLQDLEGYVTWAGRYPFPKREAELFAVHHSSRDHKLGESLWQRLFGRLKGNGWVAKMDGTKLPTV